MVRNLAIPDTYNYDLALKKFGNLEKFYNCQIIYRKRFEKILKEHIDFSLINSFINIEIPVVDDAKYNWYRANSTFGSDYLYLRNNFHVERLEDDEIKQLLSNDIDDKFILDTYKNIIFEGNGKVEVNYEDIDSFVDGNTLWFEFAFDSSLVKELSKLKQIESIILKIKKQIEKDVTSNFDIKCSFIKYECLPRVYDVSDNE